MKLDVSKAHSRIEWVHLGQVRKKLGLAQVQVESCVISVQTMSFAVLLNGELISPRNP